MTLRELAEFVLNNELDVVIEKCQEILEEDEEDEELQNERYRNIQRFNNSNVQSYGKYYCNC